MYISTLLPNCLVANVALTAINLSQYRLLKYYYLYHLALSLMAYNSQVDHSSQQAHSSLIDRWIPTLMAGSTLNIQTQDPRMRQTFIRKQRMYSHYFISVMVTERETWATRPLIDTCNQGYQGKCSSLLHCMLPLTLRTFWNMSNHKLWLPIIVLEDY